MDGGFYYEFGRSVVGGALLFVAGWLGWTAAHADAVSSRWEWPVGVAVFLVVMGLGAWLLP
jgi:hypothetical protein